ncbi:hypothetical protein BG015_009724 [Linnemannia schmuckeri]|uniref:F-box domain-containing protein n=1 Tax=Linnemannia schmuckeri TaxID=64567 RepID=A0A9P5V9D4_9FUNG|nr:hypothetical protein BG015_009724 [Linnemannia schmuckeri]
MTRTSDPTPFELPEIREHIGSLLDHEDRLTCILINKPWHSTMTSLLWEKVTLVDTQEVLYQPLQKISVPLDIIKKNAGLVKTLIIQSDLFAEYYDIAFPILQTVSFWPKRPQGYPREPSAEAFEGLARLIKQNPSISQLKLGVSKGRAPAPNTIWEAMAEAPNLQLLEAPRMRIRHTTMPLFWKATQNLRVLIVNFESALRFGNSDDGTGGPFVFPRLKRLSLEVSQGAHIMESEQIRLMVQCPQLETLDWIPDQAFSPEKFLECCRAETWPNLEGLTLARLDLYTDSDIKVILESMRKKVTILGVSRSGFGPRSFEVLRPHFFSGIIELDLSYCSAVTSAMIVEVLASCNKLRKFAAGCVSAKDLVASPPWICGSLRELWLYFDMSNDASTEPAVAENETIGSRAELEQEEAAIERTQRQIFERIANLEMLQSFSFSDPTREIPLRSLDLRLGKGLELLSSLRELKGIHFHGTQQWMRTEDVVWMLVHWEHLHWMGGVMDMTDPGRNADLVKMITDRGIYFAS